MIAARCATAIGLAAVVGVVACEPTLPTRDCVGCTYDFVDTVPPDTILFHWPSSGVRVRFWADPQGAMPALVSLGIATWEAQFLYGEFRGATVSDSNAADVIVRWAAGAPADVPPDTANPVPACDGVTNDSLDASGHSLATPVHVTLSVKGGYQPAQIAACVRRVVIHELGHALGLLKHSPYANDIMYATPLVTRPSAEDQRTIERLYHSAPTVTPPVP